MAKKKKAASDFTASVTATDTDTSTLLGNPTAHTKEVIHDHCAFFDKLIECIPARFYLPQNDDSSDHPKAYFHGLSKAAKDSLKVQSRKNLKLARRNRHDPEKIPQSSTLDILRQSLQPPAVEVEDEDNIEEKDESEKSVTYEQLRQKLRRKIELLRGNRGEKPKEYKGNKFDRKRKIEDVGQKEEAVTGGKSVNSTSSEGEPVIEYGKVRLSSDNGGDHKRKKKRRMSKEKELERARRLEEVKRDNPKAAEKEMWKSATIKAMGQKVHDDPKLLKQSMKKEQKRKEKNAEKWKERKEDQGKAKDARQQKRKENITGKIKETKMRKIAKREKKLMRPGFEGRKKEYITKD